MTTIPRFGQIPLAGEGSPAHAESRFAHRIGVQDPWVTPEQIAVAPLFGDSDVTDLDFRQTYPGIPPFLRGPYATMYVNQPLSLIHI